MIGIYILTVIISITIAILLVHTARISTQVKAENSGGIVPVFPAEYTDSSLHEAITNEITELVGSKQRGKKISNAVSNIFSAQLHQKIEKVKQELKEKYETIIEKTSQNEQVTWKKYQKVAVDKKQTEAVLRSIAAGLVVVDPEGKIIMMNPAAEKLLGISMKDKISKSIYEGAKDEQLISLIRGPAGGEDKEIELISGQDETKKILRASTAVIENENGQTVGMVSMLSDITKQKELDQLKANFVANVSHELRTPLVSIGKSISLILDKTAGELSSFQEEALIIADRNLKRLRDLIEELLDFSKLEAGKIQVKLEMVSLEKIINEAVDSLASWAGTKSITVEKKIRPGFPEINADPNRIIQVLINLIGNAIKFTPHNGIIIVEAALNSDGRMVEVSVKDNGIGISQEDLPKVFNRFYQVSAMALTDVVGTGIGLTITKAMVELHGGQIWAESQKGEGAKFIFTLPLK